MKLYYGLLVSHRHWLKKEKPRERNVSHQGAQNSTEDHCRVFNLITSHIQRCPNCHHRLCNYKYIYSRVHVSRINILIFFFSFFTVRKSNRKMKSIWKNFSPPIVPFLFWFHQLTFYPHNSVCFSCVIIFKEIVAYKVGKSRCIRRWEKAESPTVPRQALLTLMKRSVIVMPMKIKASKTTMEEAQVTAQWKRVRKRLDLMLDPSYQGCGGHLIFIFALFMPFNGLEDKRVSSFILL